MEQFKILFAVWILPLQLLASAPSLETTCYEDLEAGNFEWSYCLSKNSNSQPRDILYYFHGLGGSAKSWQIPFSSGNSDHYIEQLRKRWSDKNFEAPLVISISFGPAWFLSLPNPSPISGMTPLMLEEMIPTVEKTLGFKPQRRYMLGQSMGGHNALELYMNKPKMFDRVALLCPAVYDLSLHASDDTWALFTAASNADPNYISKARYLGKEFFPDVESEEQTAIRRAHKELTVEFPPLYLSSGTLDEYGFYPATLNLANKAKEVGLDYVWDSVEGGRHCAPLAQRIADFFMNEKLN